MPVLVFAALVMSLGLAVPGYMLRFRQRYDWILGYKNAPSERKSEWAIEGLARYLGSGLIALSAVALLASVASALGSRPGLMVLGCLFVYVATMLALGARQFTPAGQRERQPADAKHLMLRLLLPPPAYRAVERSSRQWIIECKCGYREDLWDAGAVHLKSKPGPKQLRYCEHCRGTTWHTTRRKADMEHAARVAIAQAIAGRSTEA